MSLLTICQDVARNTPIEVPTAIYGSSNKTAKMLFSCTKDAGEYISRCNTEGWTAQQKEYEFTGLDVDLSRKTLVNTDVGFNDANAWTISAGDWSVADSVLSGNTQTSCSALQTPTIDASKTYTVKIRIDSISQGTLQVAVGTESESFTTAGTKLFSLDGSGTNTISLTGTSSCDATVSNFSVHEGDHTTPPSGRKMALPSDFKKLIDGTVWDRTNYWQTKGALNARQWQVRKSSILGSTVSTTKRFRLKYSNTKVIVFDPDPEDTDSFVLEYVSSNWCESSDGVDQSGWLADTDTPLIADEHTFYLETRWRALRRLGMDYQEERKEAIDEIDKMIAQDAGGQDLSIGGVRQVGLLSTQNVPDTGFGS